jgi:hypothetical protein
MLPRPSAVRVPVCEPLEGRQLLAADLVVSELTGKLPAELVNGTQGRVPGLGVRLTNAGDTAVRATAVMFRVYASLDGALDGSDVLLNEVPKNLRMRAGGSRHVPLKLAMIPAVPQGVYRLLATADATNIVSEDNEANNSIASIGSVAIGPPFVNLTASDLRVGAPLRPGRPTRITLTVLNAGNGTARGTGVVNVVFTPVGQSGETPVNVTVRINVRAKKTGPIRGRIIVPTALTAGQYTVRATLGTTNGFTETNTGDNSATATPVTVL